MPKRKGKQKREEVGAGIHSRFRQPDVKVGLVGLGYVGLPLALLFARRGLRTTGFDIDAAKIEKLERGETYIRHIPAADIQAQLKAKLFRASSDFNGLKEMDAIIICVPTPLDEHREPDLSYIRNTAEAIGAHLHAGQLVVLESTTYPGTTEDLVLPILERSGLHCAIQPYEVVDNKVEVSGGAGNFLLAFSPEREDPGNQVFKTHQIPKVMGGVNAASAWAAQALYGQVFDRTKLLSSSRAAEMGKLLENIYRCVNIALVNEMKQVCMRMGIDIWEVIEAAKTKPFGFTPFYPGPGLGGHCIPIDPFYLTWKAREFDVPTRFIELAGEVNSAMPEFVINALAEALNQRKQCLGAVRVLVLGVAYKKDIDDLRESPSLRIMKLLQARGAHVDYNDPYFPRLHKMRHYDFKLASVDLTPATLAAYDAVVISTAHSSYDFDEIVRHSRLVIDTRNATSQVKVDREKIVKC
ncbi:MAG TPA: nucleotide sugar dehydrogenase [Terriglobia bacterium]|nr:nucleotide sugar dehydrogenase [Terriglobia bacterium]